MEKPPAVDAADAAGLAAISPAPWVGFNRRFDPGAAAVRAAVPPDGDVDLRLEIGYRRAGWGAHHVRDDALLDLGPHLIDWVRWISGSDVTEVACTECTPDRAAAELTLRRGLGPGPAPGPGDAARRDRPAPRRARRAARRTRRDLLARHRLGGLAAAVRGRLGRSGPTALVTTLAGQIEAFARAAGGEPTPTLGTAADGSAVMAVVDAARASAAAGGRPIPITSAGVH